MKKLKVDMAELEAAFEDASWEMNYYLDLETGEVITVTDEMRLYWEEPPDYPLPDWQQEWVEMAKQVEDGYGSRYVSVPQGDSRQGYQDMERFISTVQDDCLREQLWRAIEGRGAFRYFKDVLADHPRERERWFDFKNEQVRWRVLNWLESIGIEPTIEPESESEEETPPAPPPVRERFIAELLAFVRGASRLPGVTRIALLGSLTTDEPEPEDGDVLVTVTNEADLAPLAKLARQLRGHLQQINWGADVFLADPAGNYLGRTCPWKRCAPGIRLRCDALHCGRRPYLHDDLNAIRLDKALIARPPITLWPHIIARVPVPEDVEHGLLAPLEGSSLSERRTDHDEWGNYQELSNEVDAAIEDLTLLLLYLTSWEEQVVPSRPPIHRAWKGFRFEVLDTLEEKGLLSQSRRAKSVVLTEEGVRKSRELQAKYFGTWVEERD